MNTNPFMKSKYAHVLYLINSDFSQKCLERFPTLDAAPKDIHAFGFYFCDLQACSDFPDFWLKSPIVFC
jgi:hypothetical protein